jgi:outer membrane protein assembly factor BamB
VNHENTPSSHTRNYAFHDAGNWSRLGSIPWPEREQLDGRGQSPPRFNGERIRMWHRRGRSLAEDGRSRSLTVTKSLSQPQSATTRITQDAVIVACRSELVTPDKTYINSLTNEKTTSSEFVVWSMMLNSYRNASPLLSDDCLYMLEQSAGIVRCFDAHTGDLHYQKRIPEATGFTASPCASNGKVFLQDDSGLTVVIEPGRDFKMLSSNRLDEEIFWSSAAVTGDRLLLRSMQHLYCIGTAAR